jgi:hypothetical protein
MRDFNNAKFADEEHTVIEGIITDVFVHDFHRKSSKIQVEDVDNNAKDSKFIDSDYGNLRELL